MKESTKSKSRRSSLKYSVSNYDYDKYRIAVSLYGRV